MNNISKIKDLLAVDHPSSGPWDADDTIAMGQFNAIDISRNRTSMTGREVAEGFVNSEYDVLADVVKSQVIALVASDDLDPFGFGANVIKDAFGSGSDTVAALATVRTETISLATQEGLPTIKLGWIEQARAS